MNRRDITIIGPGSVGSFLTYILNRSDVEPMLVFREVVSNEIYIDLREEKTVKLRYRPFLYNNRDWVDSKIIIITSKAYDAEKILIDLRSLNIKPDLILLVQNGLKIFELATEFFGPDKVAQIVLNHGIERVDKNRFKWNGGGISYLGMLKNYSNTLLGYIYDLFKDLGIILVDDIQPYRWLKLAVNSVINPMTALLRERNKVVVENIYIRDYLAKRVCEEVKEVAERLGIVLPKDPYEETLRVARETGDNVSSMLKDLINCRKTEIDYINGAVVEFGRKIGLKTYVNETLYYLVKSREMMCHARENYS
jgi:2-dehydropantoate 2-reductase